jgi:hypothetical protein
MSSVERHIQAMTEERRGASRRREHDDAERSAHRERELTRSRIMASLLVCPEAKTSGGRHGVGPSDA